MRLFGTIHVKILVMSIVFVALGVAAVVGLQEYRSVGSVAADALSVNGPISSDEVSDGDGVSHLSQVMYAVEYHPFVATVDNVRYGGRHTEHFCSYSEKWRHQDTRFYYWNGFSWRLQEKTGSGGWMATGNPGLDYHTFAREVALEWGARVNDVLGYKGTNWCLNSGWSFSGSPHRHYLE